MTDVIIDADREYNFTSLSSLLCEHGETFIGTFGHSFDFLIAFERRFHQKLCKGVEVAEKRPKALYLSTKKINHN